MSESSDDEYDDYSDYGGYGGFYYSDYGIGISSYGENNKKAPRCTECRFRINDPICRYQTANWGGYPIPMYDRSNIKGFKFENKPYCILCYGYIIGISNTVDKLERQNEKLEKSNKELTNKLKNTESERDQSNIKIKELEKQIEDMIYYAPEGPGYSKAKEHFEEQIKNEKS